MSKTTFNSDLIKAVFQDEITIRFCYCNSTGQYEIVTERGIEVLSAKYEKHYNQAEQLFADEITHRFGYKSRSDQFREGLENLVNEKSYHMPRRGIRARILNEDRLIDDIMMIYNEVHK